MNEITVVDIPALQVLGIRRRGPYRMIPGLLGEIFRFATGNGVQFAGMPMLLMHETSAEDAAKADAQGTADVEVAVPVRGEPVSGGDIRWYTVPGGRMARIVHMGPYEGCEESYRKIMEWIGAQGLCISGPVREVYHNDPAEVQPGEIMTEILVPVR